MGSEIVFVIVLTASTCVLQKKSSKRDAQTQTLLESQSAPPLQATLLYAPLIQAPTLPSQSLQASQLQVPYLPCYQLPTPPSMPMTDSRN